MTSIDKEKIHLTTIDFLVSHEEFSLVRNDELGLLETKPQPGDLKKYYDSEEYISHTDSKKGLIAYLYQTIKKYSLRRKLRLINKLNSQAGVLLDIGAGTGDFLRVARLAGWETFGMEPNLAARNVAAKKGIALKTSLREFKNRQFDVVTLWHVLEHMNDLEETVTEITDRVKPGGKLVIAVPNYNSYDANYYGRFWAAYDVPRHLWHFSRSSIAKLFEPEMKMMAIKPMLFDSFYVSLLSEKYKTSRSNMIRAFWTGLRSNISAMRSKEYSSLIYCLERRK